MKIKNVTVGLFLFTIILLTSQFKSGSPVFGNGAPQSKSGSPGDNGICSDCHGGVPININNSLTSDIPVTGYIPGAIYNVTASISHSSLNKFGFEVSPQNLTGQQKGVLVSTTPAKTQLLSSGKWITHVGTGTTGTLNATSWSFQWVAPAAGSGSLSLYAAYVASNADFGAGGEIVYKASLPITEDLSVGLVENENVSQEWSMFPLPCKDILTISNVKSQSQKVRIVIRNITGKILIERAISSNKENIDVDIAELNSGIYIITVFETNRTLSKKLIKL
ncbi:MAG: choice-of-anchor V domain-containing protein [Bacteroidota bacterium]|nr:choice-of-anchor V domain-containing protein [Bacteroidota bacterium]MDP3143842.1 choice-of-anchor V domain-containing protein [Bacteroidota bacterium]